MNSKSRFTKIAVSAGLVVMSGAAVLGLTGYASAHLAPSDTPVAAEQVVVPSADGQSAGQDATVAAAGDVIAAGDVAAADAPGQQGHTPISPVNLAKALGLSETELQAQVQSGKSLADIAKAQNVDIQKVKDALVADLKAHLDAEVKAGVHTQAEADAKLAGFTARLDDIVNGVRPAGAPGKGGAPRFATDALAKVLGISTTELNTQLQSGKSLADIAKAQNVDVQKVKDQLLADFTAKEQAEVASGEHTQAEVDAKVAEFKTRLDDMVNGVRPAGAPGMGGDHGPMGGHEGKGGRHGHGPMGGDFGRGPAGTQDTGFSA